MTVTTDDSGEVLAKPDGAFGAGARRELLVIAAVAVVVVIAEFTSDAVQRATIWILKFEDLFVAEFLGLLFVAAVGLAIYSWRRYRENVRWERATLRLQTLVDRAEEANLRYRNVVDAVLRGQEQERMRLAHELHDDTIHRLILLGQKLELARLDIGPVEKADGLEETQHILNATIDHLRLFIQDLRPTFLDELGLVPALHALAKEKADRTGIDMTFETVGSRKRLDDDQKLILYRIAQSALRNVVLHSEATEAHLQLSFLDEAISLKISDDGIGFDFTHQRDAASEGHFGLLGMKERAELAGGRLHIQSAKQAGTTIVVELPASTTGNSSPTVPV